MFILVSDFHQISVKDEQNHAADLRLLQLNLFEECDLMDLLRGDPAYHNHASDTQCLYLES
ncbi:hypothetical protein C8R34_10770 [Nitrosomonas sp. Nm84]|nr:hypothetical protein C8R34_10770 [Nitrosomonas sp. Nm84]